MSVRFDAYGNSGHLNPALTTVIPITVGDHPNRILIVFASTYGATTISTVKWRGTAPFGIGGVALTKHAAFTEGSLGNLHHEMWYLLMPDSAADSVYIVWSASGQHTGTAGSFYGAKQVAPYPARGVDADTAGVADLLIPGLAGGRVVSDLAHEYVLWSGGGLGQPAAPYNWTPVDPGGIVSDASGADPRDWQTSGDFAAAGDGWTDQEIKFQLQTSPAVSAGHLMAAFIAPVPATIQGVQTIQGIHSIKL